MIVDLSGDVTAGERAVYECPIPAGTTTATVRIERRATWGATRVDRALRVEFWFVRGARESQRTFFETDTGVLRDRAGQDIAASFVKIPIKGEPDTFRASLQSRLPLATRLTVEFL